jgi:hypothetical protein
MTSERVCTHAELPDTLWARLHKAEKALTDVTEAVDAAIREFGVPVAATGITLVAADRVRAAIAGAVGDDER